MKIVRFRDGSFGVKRRSFWIFTQMLDTTEDFWWSASSNVTQEYWYKYCRFDSIEQAKDRITAYKLPLYEVVE